MSKAVSRAAKVLKRTPEPAKINEWLSSGSTLINLSVTGRTKDCFRKGGIYLLVGDSSTGKSSLLLETLAQAALDPRFSDHALIHDDSEFGSKFDTRKRYPVLVPRLKPPRGTPENPTFSVYLEDFSDYLNWWLDRGPVVYGMDSWDALKPRVEHRKEEENRKVREKAREKGTEAQEKGDYAMSKAKVASKQLALVNYKLAKTGSILIIVAQTRDKINPPGTYSPPGADTKTRSGGTALTFWNNVEFWLSEAGKVKKEIEVGKGRKKSIQIGRTTLFRAKKNRENGKNRQVKVTFLDETGLDDAGSMYDYLTEWGFPLDPDEFGLRKNLGRDKTVEALDADPRLYRKLQLTVKRAWEQVEAKVAVTRRNRYALPEEG